MTSLGGKVLMTGLVLKVPMTGLVDKVVITGLVTKASQIVKLLIPYRIERVAMLSQLLPVLIDAKVVVVKPDRIDHTKTMNP